MGQKRSRGEGESDDGASSARRYRSVGGLDDAASMVARTLVTDAGPSDLGEEASVLRPLDKVASSAIGIYPADVVRDSGDDELQQGSSRTPTLPA